jgi:hypothetical protein
VRADPQRYGAIAHVPPLDLSVGTWREICNGDLQENKLTSSSNPYLVSGESFPQAVRAEGLRSTLYHAVKE